MLQSINTIKALVISTVGRYLIVWRFLFLLHLHVSCIYWAYYVSVSTTRNTRCSAIINRFNSEARFRVWTLTPASFIYLCILAQQLNQNGFNATTHVTSSFSTKLRVALDKLTHINVTHSPTITPYETQESISHFNTHYVMFSLYLL